MGYRKDNDHREPLHGKRHVRSRVEVLFAEQLDRWEVGYAYEPDLSTLRIGGDTWMTPDFLVPTWIAAPQSPPHRTIAVVELKDANSAKVMREQLDRRQVMAAFDPHSVTLLCTAEDFTRAVLIPSSGPPEAWAAQIGHHDHALTATVTQRIPI